jgi:MerR family transcriptional regulator, thiopeptide resistance regulator
MENQRPASIAKRLGIGLKALRLWEAEGLIKPYRLANGWRVFRNEDVTAAWRISALKQLGFSLRAIKALLSRGTPSLDVILSVQERVLGEQLAQIQRAKSAIQAARAKLAGGAHLDADALITLHQETNMTNNFVNPTTEKLWDETFTPDQIASLKVRPFTAEDQERVGSAWAAVITEADRLRAIGDPASVEALALGRRWFGLVREFTQSDPDMIASSRSFYAQGFADPQTSGQMPFDKSVWEFMGKVAEQLIARGETIT